MTVVLPEEYWGAGGADRIAGAISAVGRLVAPEAFNMRDLKERIKQDPVLAMMVGTVAAQGPEGIKTLSKAYGVNPKELTELAAGLPRDPKMLVDQLLTAPGSQFPAEEATAVTAESAARRAEAGARGKVAGLQGAMAETGQAVEEGFRQGGGVPATVGQRLAEARGATAQATEAGVWSNEKVKLLQDALAMPEGQARTDAINALINPQGLQATLAREEMAMHERFQQMQAGLQVTLAGIERFTRENIARIAAMAKAETDQMPVWRRQQSLIATQEYLQKLRMRISMKEGETTEDGLSVTPAMKQQWVREYNAVSQISQQQFSSLGEGYNSAWSQIEYDPETKQVRTRPMMSTAGRPIYNVPAGQNAGPLAVGRAGGLTDEDMREAMKDMGYEDDEIEAYLGGE